MSANMNLVVLCGNLTRTPELRYTPGGSPVCAFSVAVNRKWKDAQGEWKEEVAFVDCEAWGAVAMNVSQYLQKGAPVLVRGRLKLDRWTDKADGKQRSKLKVVAEVVQFLGGGRGREEGPEAAAPAAEPAAGAGDAVEDVPF